MAAQYPQGSSTEPLSRHGALKGTRDHSQWDVLLPLILINHQRSFASGQELGDQQ